MFPSLRRAAVRKGLAAGLATVVAAAGIGVAVAVPDDDRTVRVVPTGAVSETTLRAEDPLTTTVPAPIDQHDVPGSSASGDGDTQAQRTATVEVETTDEQVGIGGDQSVSTPPSPAFDDELRDFVDDLTDDVGGGAGSAEEAGALASGVIARIQACVGNVLGEGFDFEDFEDFEDFAGSAGSDRAQGDGNRGRPGSSGAGGPGPSFATGIVEDVLPCVAGLVDDTLRCVTGLVEEILAVVMSMDMERIMGIGDVVVDELVACVTDA